MTSVLPRPFQVFADHFDPPPELDVWTALGYRPNERQHELHQVQPFATGGPWDVLFGGAMGGGKTVGLVHDAIRVARQYPRIEIWFVRSQYREIERDVLPILERMAFASAVGGRWHGSSGTLRFTNGSRITFIHAENRADAASVRGECQYLIVDERTLVDPDAVDLLTLRIRSGSPNIPVIGVRSGCNPGGPGHGRMKSEFIDPAPLGRQLLAILDDEGAPVVLPDGRILERYFIPSLARDNPHIDASYTARFARMTPALQSAYRDGDWTGFPDMRFDRWRTHLHVVKPFEIPISGAVRKGVGVDRGSSSPFAAVWGALIDDQLVVYRELHADGLTPTEQARLIRSSEMDDERGPGRPVPVWLDPECWARSPDNPLAKPIGGAPPSGSIADSYVRAGLPVEKADNRRVDGWSRIDELLSVDESGRPRMVIFDTCTNIIRSVSSAPRDKRNPEDVDHNYRDDHAADGARYLAMGLGGRLVGERRTVRSRRNGDRVSSLTSPIAKMGF